MTLINRFYYFIYRRFFKKPCKSEVVDMVFSIDKKYLTPGDLYYLNKYIRTGKNEDFIRLFTELYDHGFFVLDTDVKR